ncbi:MAG: prepilin-type cleavage/methylation domain-containing protein, partial [Sterolibacterium sp.]|nr:prepilin-type cleavage/methylation domain-containing protein [Sterolibacterium sp.]
LKGQEMVENSRVKNAINEMNGVAAAYNSYLDRYRRLPGDDGDLDTLNARGGSWAAVSAAGNNNGVLNVTQAQVFTGEGEGTAFWQHLRAAGFINGNPVDEATAALPRNAFNGLMGVGSGVSGMVGNAVCLGQVSGKAARQIDTQLDDGNSDSGSIRATEGSGAADTAPGTAATAYNDEKTYTVCRTL